MQLRKIGLLMLTAVIMILAGCVAADIEPPVARIEPKVDTVLGDVRVDDYFWMRERDAPEVLDYLNAENDYTEAVMKHTEAFREKVYQEIKSRIKETDLSVPVRRGDYYYYYREEEGKQYKIYCRKKGSLESEEQILLDVNKLAEGKEFMNLGTYEISPDHSLLAYGTDDKGSERYDLKILNLETGELSPETIESMSGNAVWANDNRTLYYTVPDDAWRTYRL